MHSSFYIAPVIMAFAVAAPAQSSLTKRVAVGNQSCSSSSGIIPFYHVQIGATFHAASCTNIFSAIQKAGSATSFSCAPDVDNQYHLSFNFNGDVGQLNSALGGLFPPAGPGEGNINGFNCAAPPPPPPTVS